MHQLADFIFFCSFLSVILFFYRHSHPFGTELPVVEDENPLNQDGCPPDSTAGEACRTGSLHLWDAEGSARANLPIQGVRDQ